MDTQINFKSEKLDFTICCPEWFLIRRGSKGSLFKQQIATHGHAFEASEYTYIQDVMGRFSTDSIFLDIGANIGIISVPIAMKGYPVLAIEPVPDNLVYLQKNILLNNVQDKVKVFSFLALDTEGTDTIYAPEEGDCATMVNDLKNFNNIKNHTIETHRIDDWLIREKIDTKKIKLIKIDVQGSELSVIRGLKGLLEAPYEMHLILEIHPQSMLCYNHNPDDIFKEMRSYEFSSLTIGKDNYLFTKKSE